MELKRSRKNAEHFAELVDDLALHTVASTRARAHTHRAPDGGVALVAIVQISILTAVSMYKGMGIVCFVLGDASQ